MDGFLWMGIFFNSYFYKIKYLIFIFHFTKTKNRFVIFNIIKKISIYMLWYILIVDEYEYFAYR